MCGFNIITHQLKSKKRIIMIICEEWFKYYGFRKRLTLKNKKNFQSYICRATGNCKFTLLSKG